MTIFESMENIFKKIRNIIKSWFLYLFTDVPMFAIKRRNICSGCKYNTKVAKMDVCSKCYCVISFKTLVEDERCLDGK